MEAILGFLIQSAVVVIFFIMPLLIIIGLFTYKQDKSPDISFPDKIVIKIEHVSENSDGQSPCPQSHSAPSSEPSSPTGKEVASQD